MMRAAVQARMSLTTPWRCAETAGRNDSHEHDNTSLRAWDFRAHLGSAVKLARLARQAGLDVLWLPSGGARHSPRLPGKIS